MLDKMISDIGFCDGLASNKTHMLTCHAGSPIKLKTGPIRHPVMEDDQKELDSPSTKLRILSRSAS